MIDKNLLVAGMQLHHTNLGNVAITEECIHLNNIASESDSCFVQHDGEIKEITTSLLQYTFG